MAFLGPALRRGFFVFDHSVSDLPFGVVPEY
jgi:hypothetical protein